MHTHIETLNESSFRTPQFPYLCGVCSYLRPEQIVPDRSLDYDEFWWVDYMCTVCFDEYLSLFPICPGRIRAREVTGRWVKKGPPRASQRLL